MRAVSILGLCGCLLLCAAGAPCCLSCFRRCRQCSPSFRAIWAAGSQRSEAWRLWDKDF